jgi:hypothetical protein
MATVFKDRQSTYPNRYKITLEDGTTAYVTLERADEPTVEGTPLTAAVLNQLSQEGHTHAASAITSGTLSMARGGTGAANGATALKNLLASGSTVLSSHQYGDALPAAGNKGRLFFKKVSQ